MSLRSVFRPAGFCGVVVLRGEEPGFGEPVGEGVGLVDGLADGATVGLATGGLFGAVFAGGSQALNMATLAARIVDNINDLLIVFLLKIETRGRNAVRSTDITAGLDAMRLSANREQNARDTPLHTNAALDRTRPRRNSCRVLFRPCYSTTSKSTDWLVTVFFPLAKRSVMMIWTL